MKSLGYGIYTKYFWADAISTACYVLNRILICPILNKTPYELLKGRKSNLSHIHVLGCKCFILNNGKKDLGNFDSKYDEGIFLGNSQSSRAYRVYNKRLLTVEEFVHVTFDESYPRNVRKCISFHDVGISSEDMLNYIKEGIDQPVAVKLEKEEVDDPEKEKEESLTKVDNKDYPIDNILGYITKGITTCSKISSFCYHFAFMSQIEPKNAKEALINEH